MTYAIAFTEDAFVMLEEIEDLRVKGKLIDRIRKLSEEPEKQGKRLVNELSGCRSVRAVGQRYRIVYSIQEDVVKVLVVGLGIRKEGHRADVYARMTKIFRKK
jgi:mRNA interferase RelE/StbE